MNYESFQWNFSSSTNPEIVKSVLSNKCTWIENDGIKIWQSTLVDTYMQRKIHVLLFISLLLYVGKTSPVGSEAMSIFFQLDLSEFTNDIPRKWNCCCLYVITKNKGLILPSHCVPNKFKSLDDVALLWNNLRVC